MKEMSVAMPNAMDYTKGKTSCKSFALQYIKQEMGRAKLLPKTVRLSMPNAMDYTKGKTPKKTVRLS